MQKIIQTDQTALDTYLILESGNLTGWEFWLITQEPESFQTLDFCRQKINDMNFHLTANLEKHNDKILGKTIKSRVFGYFGPILPTLVKSNFL